MDVQLTRAEVGQRPVIARLLEFNAYELSSINDRPVNQDGTYGYKYLDAYWSEADRVPYLMLVSDELAGFALVRGVDRAMSVAEFLVLPKFRGRGVGRRGAQLLFAQHPGAWRVDQLAGNDRATKFWRSVIPVPFAEHVAANGSIVQTFSAD